MTYLTQLTTIERAMIPEPFQNQMNSEKDFEDFIGCYGKIVEDKKFPEHLVSATEKLKQFILSPKKEEDIPSSSSETVDGEFISRVKEISKLIWPKYCKIKAIESLSEKEVTKNKILNKPEVKRNLSVGNETEASKVNRENTKHYILSLVALSKSILIQSEIKHFFFFVSAINWNGLIQATSSDESKPSKFFDKAFAVIDEALALNIPIFVHCKGGIERSPALVIAYLMKRLKKPYKEAYQLLKTVRPEIKVEENPNLNEGLIAYGHKLEEKLTVKQTP